MALQSLTDLLPVAEHATETLHCDRHGDYTATHMIGSIWTRCPQCEAEREAKAKAREAELASIERSRAIEAAMRKAEIPARFADRTLDTYRATNPGQAKALEVATRYAEDVEAVMSEGRCLVLCGKPGTGKTHLAVGIAKRFIAAGHSAQFTSAMNAIRAVRETYRRDSEMTERQAVEAFAKPGLVILDEVGQQLGTEAEKVTLFDLINARYERMRPMIVISNLTIDEVRDYLGERAFDRLRENGGQAVTFTWESHRRAA